MKPLADGVWQIEGPSLNMIAGVMIPSRSTVLRLANDRLLVYSPVAAMDVPGEVAHIVAPSRWHHLFVGAAHARWPVKTTPLRVRRSSACSRGRSSASRSVTASRCRSIRPGSRP